MEIESNYLLKMRTGSRDGALTSPVGHGAGQALANTPPSTSYGNPPNIKSELDTTDDKTSREIPEIPNGSAEYEAGASELENDVDNLSLHNPTRVESKLLEIDPASVGITSHTDIFIHSGTRLCYGILLVVFSMIENPLFNKILYIVGFKGDRERNAISLASCPLQQLQQRNRWYCVARILQWPRWVLRYSTHRSGSRRRSCRIP